MLDSAIVAVHMQQALCVLAVGRRSSRVRDLRIVAVRGAAAKWLAAGIAV